MRPMLRRRWLAAIAVASTWHTAPLLLAQGSSEGGSAPTTSWFMMFFLPPDWIGITIIWTLLAMSLVTFSLTIKFVLQYRRPQLMPVETQEEIESLLAEKKYRDAIDYARGDPSYLGVVTSAALAEASNGYGAMERAVEETGDAETTKILRPIEYLNVMGSIAPMLGLFGTVYGMIVAFQKLVAAGGKPNPADLAGGISTALVTTFWGLVVAIPALAAYALIRNKIDALTSEGMVVAEELIVPFKPSGKRKSKKGESRDSDSGSGIPRRRATPQPERLESDT